jgi:hypothetical protein
MRVPVLPLARSLRQVDGERSFPPNEGLNDRADPVEILEARHPFGARPDVIQGLRAAHHQYSQDGLLVPIKIKVAAEPMGDAGRPPAVVHLHQVAFGELIDDVSDLSLGKIHDRLAAAFLVTGEGQSVDGQRASSAVKKSELPGVSEWVSSGAMTVRVEQTGLLA